MKPHHPTPTLSFPSLTRGFSRVLASLLTLVFSAAIFAAEGANGTIEGRVFNGASGLALGNARVILEGTGREAITDGDGAYRFTDVPAGEARLAVSYLGSESQTVGASVPASGTVRRDIDLVRSGTVNLQQFSVVADREMSAQAVAMNEQRYAPNIKSVVAVDEFGDRGDENIGEMMRFLPGVALNDSGLVPNEVTLRGFPANYSELMVDGGQVAGARSGNTRTISLLEVPTTNISRTEVAKVPTPDMPATGLGGSINLLTKSGFEARRPIFNYQLYLLENSRDDEIFGGGRKGHVKGTSPDYKQPSFNAGFLYPINKKFALSIGAARTWRQKPQGGTDETATWNLVNLFQRQSEWQYLSQVLQTYAFELRADWKITEKDTLSTSMHYRDTSSYITRSNLLTNFGAGATGGPTFTQGAATGVGTLTMNDGSNVEINTATTLANLMFTHKEDLWKISLAGSFSRAASDSDDINNGHFNATPSSITNLVIRGDGIGGGGAIIPTLYSAVTRTGAAVGVYDGGNYSLNSGTSAQTDYEGKRSTARLDFTRDFIGRLPFTFKTGVSIDRLDKDLRAFNQTYNFRPNGSADVTARLASNFDVFDQAYNDQAAPVYGQRVRWISPAKTYDLFRQRPDWFVLDQALAHQNLVTNSRRLAEVVSAAYLRVDARLLNNRLWLVSGVRFERTDDDGSGSRNDPNAQYVKDASGKVILTNGVPTLITTDPLARAKLRYVERGTHVETDYQGFYPSINATYNITERLLLRAAFARTIGRPNLNFIIPGSTISEPTDAAPTITVNNTGLKPWTATNYDLALESYQIKDGVGSIGVFQKDIKDFFGATRTRATPELLEQYGLANDPTYLNYDIATQTNVGDAKITGIEFSYRQSLTFLPDWARGLQVFFNTTRMRLEGNRSADFTGFNPSSLAAGINFIRPRYFIKLTCSSQDETRRGLSGVSAANGIPADTYTYQGERTRVGISTQYSFSKQFAIYGSFTDLGGGFNPLSRIYAPNTPDYAKGNRFQELGSTITIGIKGSF